MYQKVIKKDKIKKISKNAKKAMGVPESDSETESDETETSSDSESESENVKHS